MMFAYIGLGLLVLAIGASMWLGRDILRQHPIRFISLVTVEAMGVFLGYMAIWLTNTLSGPEWCGKALQAERISSQAFGGLTACVELLKIQLQSLADNSKIVLGSFSFGMVVLVVIVLAQAKGSANLPGGISGNIQPANDPVGAAADTVASAAVEKAAEVKTAAVVAPEAAAGYNGPAMPEPKGD